MKNEHVIILSHACFSIKAALIYIHSFAVLVCMNVQCRGEAGDICLLDLQILE